MVISKGSCCRMKAFEADCSFLQVADTDFASALMPIVATKQLMNVISCVKQFPKAKSVHPLISSYPDPGGHVQVLPRGRDLVVQIR